MILDLTMFIEEGMTTFQAPWHPLVEITQLGRHGFEGRETSKLILGTHTGTHVDAPLHFIPKGATLDEMDIQALVGPATMLDLHHLPPRTRIDRDDLARFLGGPVPERLLIRYDWDHKLNRKDYYRDHPYLTPDACRFLVEGGIRLLAMDSPQPDNPIRAEGDPDSPCHKVLLAGGVIIAEYLVGLDRLPATGFTIIVAPLKVRQGDGAPSRIFAIVEDPMP